MFLDNSINILRVRLLICCGSLAWNVCGLLAGPYALDTRKVLRTTVDHVVLDRLSESRKGKIGVHSSKGLPLEVWEVNHGCGKAYTWAWAAWQRVMHRRMKIGWLNYTASVWVVHLAKTWRKWALVWTWLLWDHSRRITLCLYHPLHWPFRMPCSSTSVILPCVFLSKAILRHHFAITH